MMNTPKGFTGPVNLGNPAEYQVKDLAEMIVRLTGSKSPIEYQPLPMDDPKRRQPDISLAREKLDWEPRIEVEDGLKKTIDYFRKRIV